MLGLREAIEVDWTSDGHNEMVDGVPMIADDLMFAWCWDARPLPEFPLRTDIWSDGADWANGHWLNGKLPSLPPQAPLSAPTLRAVRELSDIDRAGLVEQGDAAVRDAGAWARLGQILAAHEDALAALRDRTDL